jgi:hypothetical protein
LRATISALQSKGSPAQHQTRDTAAADALATRLENNHQALLDECCAAKTQVAGLESDIVSVRQMVEKGMPEPISVQREICRILKAPGPDSA